MMRFLILISGILFTVLGETNSQLLQSKHQDGKIVGGSTVNIKDYAYVVSVRYKNYWSGIFMHWCGGTIYSKTIIITAGHCVHRRRTIDFKIHAGSQNHNEGGQLIDVDSIIIHENYNQYTLDNDIALIILKTPLEMNVNVSTINLPNKNTNIPIGTEAVVCGWGVMNEGSKKISDKLQAVKIQVMENNECGNRYGGITRNMLCAGVREGGKDSCQGDSGGPLAWNKTLLGLVSWGYGCARPDYPGVYTNILELYIWILEKLQLI